MIPEYQRRLLYLTGETNEWGRDLGMKLYDHLEEVGGEMQEAYERLIREFKGQAFTFAELRDIFKIQPTQRWVQIANCWRGWGALEKLDEKYRGCHRYRVRKAPPLKDINQRRKFKDVE